MELENENLKNDRAGVRHPALSVVFPGLNAQSYQNAASDPRG